MPRCCSKSALQVDSCGHVVTCCGHVVTCCGHVVTCCGHVVACCGHAAGGLVVGGWFGHVLRSVRVSRMLALGNGTHAHTGFLQIKIRRIEANLNDRKPINELHVGQLTRTADADI